MKELKINKNYTRQTLQIIVIFSLIFICFKQTGAQIAVIAGGNYSDVRSNVTLKNKKPIIGHNLGVSFQYYPLKKLQNISIINELDFVQKGYHQDFEKNYSFKFNYFSFPVLINYAFLPQFSAQAGVELNSLVSTNIKQGYKTYNEYDMGLVVGIVCFGEKRISCYSRISYGLLPMLDYYEFDELGNFVNNIHDLKNTSISIGIKANIIRNEKIRFYKL